MISHVIQHSRHNKLHALFPHSLPPNHAIWGNIACHPTPVDRSSHRHVMTYQIRQVNFVTIVSPSLTTGVPQMKPLPNMTGHLPLYPDSLTPSHLPPLSSISLRMISPSSLQHQKHHDNHTHSDCIHQDMSLYQLSDIQCCACADRITENYFLANF